MSTKGGANISFVVTFPNGNQIRHSGKANGKGKLTWSFVQPGSEITHSSRSARIRVTARSSGRSGSTSKSYKIGFSRLDVAVAPRSQARGKKVTVWVHGVSFMHLGAQVRFKSRVQTFSGRAGSGGWVGFSYTVPTAAGTGTATVTGYSLAAHYTARGTTTFTVR